MGKKSRRNKPDREALDAAKQAELAAAEAAVAERTRRTRMLLIGIPVATVVLAVLGHLAFGDRRITALIGVTGLAFAFTLVLGMIGSRVPPRDTSRSGSIDFGRRD